MSSGSSLIDSLARAAVEGRVDGALAVDGRDGALADDGRDGAPAATTAMSVVVCWLRHGQ